MRCATGLVVAVLLAACGGAARPAAPAIPASPLARAEAFERGAGVPRDYRKAAGLYERHCDAGRGDPEACRRLVRATMAGRGTGVDLLRVAQIESVQCFAGSAPSCAIAMRIAWRAGGEKHVDSLREKLVGLLGEDIDGACERGDVAACEVWLGAQGLDVSGSSGREAKRDHAADLMCKQGLIAGCVYLVEGVNLCGYEADAGRCVDEWTREAGADERAALAWLHRRCDAGDAEACATLPGREVALPELCRAHDYGACAELACLGDAAAAAVAATHGTGANCYGVRNRAAAGAADVVEDEGAAQPALRDEFPLPPVTPAALPLFETLAFRRLAALDDRGWPRFEIQNRGTRAITAIDLVVYAYDARDVAVARTSGHRVTVALAPGATVAATVTGAGSHLESEAPAVAFDVCYDAVHFAGEAEPRRMRLRSTKSRHERCGDRVDRAALAVSPLVPGADPREAGAVPLLDDALIERFEAKHADTLVDARGLWTAWRGPARLAVETTVTRTGGTPRIPVLLTPVAVAYRITGVTDLRLSPATLARIFAGEIELWSDPAIQRDNPGRTLPVTTIHVVASAPHRKDVLARYLAQMAPGKSKLADGGHERDLAGYPDTLYLTRQLATSEGGIGLVDLPVARAFGLATAHVPNRAGHYVAPTTWGATAAAAAVAVDGDLGFDPTTARAADAYPLVVPVWARLAPRDRAEAERARAYLRFLLTEGQTLLATGDVGSLPPALAARALARLDAIRP
jgi:phosphate transport system substrate-binding protein